MVQAAPTVDILDTAGPRVGGYASYHLVDEVSEQGLSGFTLSSILTFDPISLHFLVTSR